MNDDGMAELMHQTGLDGPYICSEGFGEDRERLVEAQEACPVQIILVED
jgi:ferredoxin